MKLETVSLTNFKGVKEARIELNRKSVVFYGINGVGKTTILHAIDLLYSNIINRLVKNAFKQGINIELTDISFGSSECKVSADFSFDHEDTSYGYARGMNRKDKRRWHYRDRLYELTDHFEHLFLGEENEMVNMPIFVNYGVNRSVLDVPVRVRNKHTFIKISCFEKAIESRVDFRTFFEWFRYQEDYENERKIRENLGYVDVPLSAVRNAVTAVLDDVSNLRIERSPLAMKVDKNGISLQVNQLSDGEKCTLSLIGDLARRLAIANPTMKDPLLGTGVVLIDEIELHMHPAWQRKILKQLHQTFPNIQFIVTTHSPQILGEAGDDFLIYEIVKENKNTIYNRIPSLKGWDSNYILETFMGVDNVNAETKQLIRAMYQAIEDKNIEKAQILCDQLSAATDEAHEDVVRASILITRLRSKIDQTRG